MYTAPASRPILDGDSPKPAATGRRLWRWFVLGFLVAFLGMAYAVTIPTLHSSGQAVIDRPLWQYYLIEGARAARLNAPLGPTSGSLSRVIVIALPHVLCSTVAGAAMLGIAWCVHRLRVRRSG
jgi:hypothetical protein